MECLCFGLPCPQVAWCPPTCLPSLLLAPLGGTVFSLLVSVSSSAVARHGAGCGMEGLGLAMYTCAPLVCQTDSTRLVRVDEQALWWDALTWTQIQAAEV